MKITIPDKNKKQIANAIMGLVTALLLLGASVGGQVVYQLLGLEPEPVVAPLQDELIALGTTHFTAIEVEDLAATDDITIADDLTVTDDTAMTGDLAVDGTSNLDEVDIDGVTNLVVGTEHIGIPSIISTAIAYTPTTGTIATIADGEIWFVHGVIVNVTTDFDTAGNDDAALTIGDGNDADGFIVLADAELQAADTEGTGFAAGWQGMAAATLGAYLDLNHDSFIYAPSGAAETIDYAVAGTAADAGAATVYVVYTRIQ